MKRNYILRNCFLFLLFMSLQTIAQSQELGRFIEQWRQENNIPAIAVSIKKRDEAACFYFKGTTTLNGKIKLAAFHVFGVGSITKTFIAATLLQLQDAHQIDLDDAIGAYFPEYPRWSNIKIRQLLNMTSGIPNFTATDTFKRLIQSKPTKYHHNSFFVNLVYAQKEVCRPGDCWSYSNTNYYLLGMLIEKITHHNLAQELEQRFFKPYQLHHTYFSGDTYPRSVTEFQAHAYLNTEDVTQENPAYYGPAGSMLMNTNDLLLWAKALFTPGMVLSKHALDEFTSTELVPVSPPKPLGARYGLGIYSLEIKGLGLVWWYTGVIDGYSSIMMWIPNKGAFIAAQINRYDAVHFGLLMPGQPFVDRLLKIVFAEGKNNM